MNDAYSGDLRSYRFKVKLKIHSFFHMPNIGLTKVKSKKPITFVRLVHVNDSNHLDKQISNTNKYSMSIARQNAVEATKNVSVHVTLRVGYANSFTG